MTWAGANYPQEHEEPDMKASDMEPMDAYDLGYSETDGAVSINAFAVAKRLNDLLFVVQRLEEQLAAATSSSADGAAGGGVG